MRYAIAILSLMFIGVVFLFFDLEIGVSQSDVWTSLVLALGFLLAFLPTWGRRRSLKALMGSVALFAVFAAWVAVIRTETDSPIGRFHKLYWSIRVGMSTAEVEGLVGREFPGVRPSIRWHREVGFLGLEPVDPEYNSEFIEIRLLRGRVTGTIYLPD